MRSLLEGSRRFKMLVSAPLQYSLMWPCGFFTEEQNPTWTQMWSQNRNSKNVEFDKQLVWHCFFTVSSRWDIHSCYEWRPNQWHSFSCACWSPVWPAAGRWRPAPSPTVWWFLGFELGRRTRSFVLRWPTLPRWVTGPGTPNSLQLDKRLKKKFHIQVASVVTDWVYRPLPSLFSSGMTVWHKASSLKNSWTEGSSRLTASTRLLS